MIEFFETALPHGYMQVRLRSPDLPAGMYYHIRVRPDGWCEAKSRAHGNGSVRYYSHRTYDMALDHATAWAKRKIAEAAREERKRTQARRAANSAAIDRVVEAIRQDMQSKNPPRETSTI